MLKSGALTILFLGLNILLFSQNDTISNMGILSDSLKTIETGIGEISEKGLSMSIEKIGCSEFNRGISTDYLQLIKGKVAGVSISKNGGDPNLLSSIRIHGLSSYSNSNKPLYIIDGVIDANPVILSIRDIETFTILKDAASCSIYGSRGANGVIIIRTKNGMAQKGFHAEFYGSASADYNSKRLDLLNAGQMRKFVTDNNISFTDEGANTDWQDQLFRQGSSRLYQVGTTWSNENVAVRVSITKNNFTGLVKNTNRDDLKGGININFHALNKRLKISSSFFGLKQTSELLYDDDLFLQLYQKDPTDSLNSTTLDGPFDPSPFNPLWYFDQTKREIKTKSLLGNLRATYDIINGLKAGITLGYSSCQKDDLSMHKEGFTEPYIPYESERERNSIKNISIQPSLQYSFNISENQNLDIVTCFSYMNSERTKSSTHTADVNSSEYKRTYKKQQEAITGKLEYQFRKKYEVTLSIRTEKVSLNNTIKPVDRPDLFSASYPAVSVSCDLKKEFFLHGIEALNFLKAWCNYGFAGDHISFETDYTRPDKVHEMDLGVDFGFFNNRLSGTLECYKKNNKNINLLLYDIDDQLHYLDYGRIENKGIDLSLNLQIIKKEHLNWNAQIIFSGNQQIMKPNELFNNMPSGWIRGSLYTGSVQVLKNGYPVGEFYLPEYVKLSNDGQFLFYTVNGTLTSDPHLAEKRCMGSSLPKFEIGWSNYFKLGDHLSLSFSSRAVIGHNIYNETRMVLSNPSSLPYRNCTTEAIDEYNRGLRSYPVISSYYLEKASYFCVDNVNLNYRIPVESLKWLEEFNFFLAANNLFVITKYKGLDPEINYDSSSLGIENTSTYPKVRSYSIGINVKF